jgi:hypothetical protein
MMHLQPTLNVNGYFNLFVFFLQIAHLKKNLISEALKAVTIQITVLWYVMPFSLVYHYDVSEKPASFFPSSWLKYKLEISDSSEMVVTIH